MVGDLSVAGTIQRFLAQHHRDQLLARFRNARVFKLHLRVHHLIHAVEGKPLLQDDEEGAGGHPLVDSFPVVAAGGEVLWRVEYVHPGQIVELLLLLMYKLY